MELIKMENDLSKPITHIYAGYFAYTKFLRGSVHLQNI